jgi:predicted ATPase/DNA-binding NarL/FixJ family response regulator
VELTSFVGRRKALAEVKRLFAETRLVTLTGVGGTGKTRLAQRLATDVRRTFPDGVWFVDLSDLREPRLLRSDVGDPEVLAQLVAATLGLRDEPGTSPMQALADQLADQRILLVLDNCERLLPCCAILVDVLLRSCPTLRIMATSREPLSVPGEVVFAVPPLSVPDHRRRSGVADLVRSEAVALFMARAQAAMPDFDLTEATQAAVAELCRRLDGLPLAIELAAARIRVLDPQQMVDRLADRFTLLSRGNRTAPERQQTLRASVDWSFELCSKPEQELWARLTVFAGGFELDAVEGVCADEDLPTAELLDILAALVDKSIVVRDDRVGAVRYRMLDTIRDFGQERLQLLMRGAELGRAHHVWYQHLVARAHAEWVSDRQPYWLARLGREHTNLRAAVEHCLSEPGQAEEVLRIVVCLPVHFWWSRSRLSEARRWLERALDRTSEPTGLRARALLLASDLASVHGDGAAAMSLLDEGEDLARRLDDPAAMAHAAYARGIGTLQKNELFTAVQSFERALQALSGMPDSELDLHLRSLIGLGVAAGMAGDRERAGACRREMLTITERLGSDFYRSSALWSCSVVSWLGGDLQQAAAEVVESLRLKTAAGLGDDVGTALCLEVLAWITTGQQQHRRAAILLGAADALRTGQGTTIASFQHLLSHHDRCERQAREALGEAAYVDAVNDGRSLTPDEALSFAVHQRRPTAPSSSADTSTRLTRREREIADLVARGMSNKDIAATLVISTRTAESHVENILTKLGFTRRTQVAAWVAAQHASGAGR